MCPSCGEPLIIFEHRGIEIDHCVNCHGTWLDDGELERLTELAGVESGALTAALRQARQGARSERKCPRCERELREVHVEKDDLVVELDECPLRHGLWFDRGEMRALVGAHADAETELVAEFFGDLFRSELKTEES